MSISLSTSDTSVVLAAISAELNDIPRGPGFPLMDKTFTTTPMKSESTYFRDGYSTISRMVDANGMRVTQKPIVKIPNPWAKINDSQKGGGYQHIIPHLDPMVQQAIPGDNQFQGNEQNETLRYSTGYINAWGVPRNLKIGEFNEQLGGRWSDQARNRVGPQLKDWSMRMEHYHMIETMNRGYSPHITASAAVTNYLTAAGLSVSTRHNPNSLNPGLAAGSRRATWSATTATYMQSLSRLWIQAGADSSDFYMSARILRILYQEAWQYPMTPIARSSRGLPMFECWLSLAQWNQLMDDPEFGDGPISALGQYQKDVLFQNAAAVYGGLIIHIMEGVAGQVFCWKSGDTLGAITATSGNATTISYGPANSDLSEDDRHDPTTQPAAETTDNEMIKLGYVVGGMALCGIEARPSKLVPDGWDYNRKRGLSIQNMNGWFRPDIYDNAAPASATTVKSHGLMSFVTYSPN